MSTAANPQPQTVGTIAAWAKQQGITPSVARRRMKTHGIPFTDTGEVDFALASAISSESLDQDQQKRAQGKKPKTVQNGLGGSIQPVSELGKIRLRREQVELDELEGKLVRLDAVREYETQMFAKIRSSLLAIGSELRDDLAEETDPVRVEAIVNTRINQALAKIAEWTPK